LPPVTSEPATSAATARAPQRGGYTPVTSLEELDPAVRAELARWMPEPMAAAGERYQTTDVVLGDPLPERRFVVAGFSPSDRRFWVLCYAHGGIGHHHHIVLFALQSGQAVVLKAGQWLPREQPVTLESVVQALRSDEQQFPDDHW